MKGVKLIDATSYKSLERKPLAARHMKRFGGPMRSKESIARLARLLAAWAWLLGAILLAKAIWERSSIFPLGQFNEPLLGYMLVVLLGLAGAVFFIAARVLASKRSGIG